MQHAFMPPSKLKQFLSPPRRTASRVDAENASRKHVRDGPDHFWACLRSKPRSSRARTRRGRAGRKARALALPAPVSSGHGCRERGARPPLRHIPPCFPLSNVVKSVGLVRFPNALTEPNQSPSVSSDSDKSRTSEQGNK